LAKLFAIRAQKPAVSPFFTWNEWYNTALDYAKHKQHNAICKDSSV